MSFKASYLEIEPRELVRFLLREAGQCDRNSVNPADLLGLLGLQYVSFDFDLDLPDEAKQTVGGTRPRALLSFDDRIVATDSGLNDKRTRFSVLHEIGHYVLPNHEHALYVCDDLGLSFGSRLVFEKQASEFAAELLFLGDRFSLEANSRPINAMTVKELADKCRASFEATARRLVETSFRPCMLVVFKEEPKRTNEDLTKDPSWSVRYCVASAHFKNRYFEKVFGSVPPGIAAKVTEPGRDIADSCVAEIPVRLSSEQTRLVFQGEYFSNAYNIFCLLTPK